VGISPDAAAVLRRLAARGNDRDLAAGLDDLLAHVTRAVPSCLGISLTMRRNGSPITLAALSGDRHGQPVRSSLALHLPTGSPAEVTAGRGLTLYATAPDAFAAIAKDLQTLLDLDPHHAMVDGHLDLPPDDETGSLVGGQLDDLSAIDVALGVLLDRGMVAADGRLELERLAVSSGSSVATAARLVLEAVRRPPPPDDT
jgi:hypothetical protein